MHFVPLLQCKVAQLDLDSSGCEKLFKEVGDEYSCIKNEKGHLYISYLYSVLSYEAYF